MNTPASAPALSSKWTWKRLDRAARWRLLYHAIDADRRTACGLQVPQSATLISSDEFPKCDHCERILARDGRGLHEGETASVYIIAMTHADGFFHHHMRKNGADRVRAGKPELEVRTYLSEESAHRAVARLAIGLPACQFEVVSVPPPPSPRSK